MHKAYLFLLLPLAACGREPGSMTLVTGGMSSTLRTDVRPTLRVAEAAIGSGAPGIALNVTAGILQDEPRNAAAKAMHADALYALGRRGEAAAEYDAALKLRPDLAAARAGLGRALLAQGDANGAEQALRLASKSEARPETLSNLGIALDMQGRHGDAQQAYRQSLQLNPDAAATRVNLGLSLALSGDRAGTMEILRQMQSASGADGKGIAALAAALNGTGAAEQASAPMPSAVASMGVPQDVAAPMQAQTLVAPQPALVQAGVTDASADDAAPSAVPARPYAVGTPRVAAVRTMPAVQPQPAASPAPAPRTVARPVPAAVPVPASAPAPARVPAAPMVAVAALAPPAMPGRFDPASVPMPQPYQYGAVMTARADSTPAQTAWLRAAR